MLSAQTNTTVVGRLRIRSKASDPQLEQQRLGRMMRSAALHPVGLPDSALLVVRRLADPLPARLRAGPFDTQADPTWQRAVAAELERLSASAARPAFGFVPPGVNAVLFYDRAELLSSLALDWLAGVLSNQWWWRELLRGKDAITALFGEWIEAPQYVPPAFELLSKRSRLVAFVQRLPPTVTVEILDAVIKAYTIPRVRVEDAELLVVGRFAEGEEQPRPKADSVGPAVAEYKPIAAATSKGVQPHRPATERAPWTRWVPEADTPALSPIQKTLLVQALMLRRAPATARTVAFQKKLVQWQAREEHEASTGIRPMAPMRAQPTAARQQVSQYEPAPARAASVAPKQATEIEPVAPEAGATETPAQPASEPQSAAIEPIAASPPRVPEEHGVGGSRKVPRTMLPTPDQASMRSPVAPRQEPSILLIDSREAPREAPPSEPMAETAVALETAYGGVFFLLNVALYLSIYGDFTTPAEMGLELNIWDFLSLMSTNLTDGEIESDPLWSAMASLAGRPPEQRPGSSFDPPDEWRLPPEWLEPFSEDYDPQPMLRDGRMVSVHPAGFTVLDVPAGDIEKDPPEDRLQRWVGWMAQYFRARLVRALGRDDAIRLLCHLRARVAFSLTHVDVSFSLDYHPIEIRMTGLDRDPGWIPASGRYLAFHFD